MTKMSNQRVWAIVIILIFTLWFLRNLFHPGIFTAHDIWHNLARLNYYYQAITEKQIMPLYLSNLADGKGYPLFMFSYHLPWVIGSIFLHLGLGDVLTIKLLFLLGYFLSGVIMFLFAMDWIKKSDVALATSLIYLCFPYRFFVIYVSAAVGISMTFLFLPLVFWGIKKMTDKKTTFAAEAMVVIGLTGIILSHTPSLVVLSPLILMVFLLFLKKSPYPSKILLRFGGSLVLTSAICAFYLLPAITYQKDIIGLPEIYSMGFVELKQLWYSKWGYGVIVKTAGENPFSFQIGIGQWILVILTFLGLTIVRGKKRVWPDKVLLLLTFILCVFLTNQVSMPIWEFLHRTSVDFPFRFIYPAAVSATLLMPLVINNLNKIIRNMILILILVIVIYSNRNHLTPNMYLSEDDFRPFIQSEVTTSSYDEYLPKNSDTSLLDKHEHQSILDKYEIISEEASVSIYQTDFNNPNSYLIPKYYYPFLSVKIDGKETPFFKDKSGLIAVKNIKGKHSVEVGLSITPPILFGRIISFTALSICLLAGVNYIIIRKRNLNL